MRPLFLIPYDRMLVQLGLNTPRVTVILSLSKNLSLLRFRPFAYAQGDKRPNEKSGRTCAIMY